MRIRRFVGASTCRERHADARSGRNDLLHGLLPHLLLVIALAACASGERDGSGERPSTPAEGEALPRRVAEAFAAALNGPAPEQAAAFIDWRAHVAEDDALQRMMRKLRREYRLRKSAAFLDRPAFEGSSVTRRRVVEAADPMLILAAVARERFERQVRRDFAAEKRKTSARVLDVLLVPGHMGASIRMPDGHLAEFRFTHTEQGYLLVPR